MFLLLLLLSHHYFLGVPMINFEQSTFKIILSSSILLLSIKQQSSDDENFIGIRSSFIGRNCYKIKLCWKCSFRQHKCQILIRFESGMCVLLSKWLSILRFASSWLYPRVGNRARAFKNQNLRLVEFSQVGMKKTHDTTGSFTPSPPTVTRRQNHHGRDRVALWRWGKAWPGEARRGKALIASPTPPAGNPCKPNVEQRSQSLTIEHCINTHLSIKEQKKVIMMTF